MLAIIVFLCTGAYAMEAPIDVVRGTTDRFLERVNSDREALESNPDKVYSLIAEMITPHFDFQVMAQWVLGGSWRGATDSERAEFIAQFQKLLVRTYATALIEFADQSISYPAAAQVSAEKETAVVMQEISQPGGEALVISYRLHSKSGNWKVYDVSVDGVSLMKTYKASFASVVKDGGIAKLIEKLNSKTAGMDP